MQWQIGGDAGQELWYRRLSNAESPREVIEVRGSRQVGEVPKYPIISFSERYGDPRLIDPNLLGSSITIFEQLSTREIYSRSLAQLERTTRKLEPVGLIIPNTRSVFKTSLIESYYEVTTYQYETNDEGKLKRVFSTIYKTEGEVLKEYFEYLVSIDDPNAYSSSFLIIAETYTIDYLYDSKDRVSKIYTTRYKTKGELLSGLDTDWSFTLGVTPSGLTIAENNVESWTKQSNNYWIHRIDNYKTAGVVNPGFFGSQEKPEEMTDETFEDNQRSQQLSLIPDNNASLFERSNSGQTVPPAAERKPQEIVTLTESVCGKTIFSLYGGNPYKEKERSYSVEYLGSSKRGKDEDTGEPIIEDEEVCDNEQASSIAEIEGALLAGRFKGQDIGVDIKDELLSWRPLQVLDCTEPDGTIRRYALDDSHWYIGQNRAIANFGCIWLGDVRQGNLAKPYAIAQTINGTVRVGGNILVYRYSLFPIPYSLLGGVVVGGDIYISQTLQPGQIGIRGGVTVGGDLNINDITVLPLISILGGLVVGGDNSFETYNPYQTNIDGGLTVGGNLQQTTYLAPVLLNGGILIGGLTKNIINTIVTGGVIVGGNNLIRQQLILAGGIKCGGDVFVYNPTNPTPGLEIDRLESQLFDLTITDSIVDPLEIDLFN